MNGQGCMQARDGGMRTGDKDGAAARGGASPAQDRERVLGHHFVHAWVLHVAGEFAHTSRDSRGGSGDHGG
jgi:hypothetical protein